MSRVLPIFPTAPTHTRLGATAEPQVQAAKQFAANYYRASSWRSGYEWRHEDELEEEEERQGKRIPRGNTPPLVYSWQSAPTAQNYLRATKIQNQYLDQIKAGEITDAEYQPSYEQLNEQAQAAQQNGQQTGSSAEPPATLPRPMNPIASQEDSLDQFQQASSSPPAVTGHFHSASPFGNASQPSSYGAPAPANGTTPSKKSLSLTLAGYPVHLRSLPGEFGPVSQRLARAGLTGRTHQQPHTHFNYPVHAPPPQSDIGGRKIKEFQSGLGGPAQRANFQLRGAGALPTHRHTTRTSSIRLLAGLGAQSKPLGHHTPKERAQAAATQIPPHLQAHAHVANMDWSDWARTIETQLHGGGQSSSRSFKSKSGAQTAR